MKSKKINKKGTKRYSKKIGGNAKDQQLLKKHLTAYSVIALKNEPTIQFSRPDSLNFNAIFDPMKLDEYITEKILDMKILNLSRYEMEIKPFSLNDIDIISFMTNNINIISNDTKIVANLSSYYVNSNFELIKKDTGSEENFLSKEIMFLLYVIWNLNNEILTSNIILNNNKIIDENTTYNTLKDLTPNKQMNYTLCGYISLLQGIKNIYPQVSNDYLFYVLVSLFVNYENQIEFLTKYTINISSSNIFTSKIININSYDTNNKNILEYINLYNEDISNLFKVENIIDEIKKNVNNVITVEPSGNITINIKRYFFQTLENFSTEASIPNREKMLLGIIQSEKNIDFNENIVSDSLKYKWALNTQTKQLLLKEYKINNYMPYFNSIVPIYRDSLKRNIKSTGLPIPSLNIKNIFNTKKGGKYRKNKTKKYKKNKNSNSK